MLQAPHPTASDRIRPHPTASDRIRPKCPGQVAFSAGDRIMLFMIILVLVPWLCLLAHLCGVSVMWTAVCILGAALLLEALYPEISIADDTTSSDQNTSGGLQAVLVWSMMILMMTMAQAELALLGGARLSDVLAAFEGTSVHEYVIKGEALLVADDARHAKTVRPGRKAA